MFDDPLFVIVVLACAAVLIILMLGIGSFGIGGETSRKYSNKMMRWRVAAQAIAIALILLFVWLRGGTG
ncbi:Hypoxia induced protein conserved region [Aliiroseovarius sediminilitoris]|uniref:Hypoxia induced protein conserved region n=1 Tax=Aliiroseovarius sediminilitoris TaxID=1173584 RepID=A0A1I0N4N4_9RHOB|nr:twin transmembrane helix small protein [Aliiroseovarius sediminilitoris]SEV95974.1 Hypoxia induced protein conserved region [Aliiroseovarius sediminilitoris]